MTIRLLTGDCRDVLATLPAESVHCVVTSPPYLGLRDYGTALWDGGDVGCSHSATVNTDRTLMDERNAIRDDVAGIYKHPSGWRGGGRNAELRQCACGAVRVDRQIGLERSPEAYLATMVGVFREVRRVLRRDGTCWVNMGDSYNTARGSGCFDTNGDGGARKLAATASNQLAAGLASKQLLLMPARLALALQADGWWVRSDIIIAKKNPMPESARDRPTSAHEHVFLLTKNAHYYFDQDAVREANTEGTHSRGGAKTNGRDALIKSGHWNTLPPTENAAGRNIRNVWDISTEAFSGAHFATMPTSVVERCIRAGTSERGCCGACGKPWVREIEKTPVGDWRSSARSADLYDGAKGGPGGVMPGWEPARTTGWSPGCECHGHFEEHEAAADWISEETGERKRVRVWVADGDAPPPVPCTVLDPFIGAGTTALVADRLQRDCIGIDLNVDYTRMAMDRCIADAPLFTSFAPAEDPEETRMADLFTDMAAD